MLLRHLADCHFRERLCQGLPQGAEVYKCPECNHESKDKGGFVRHYGLVHKMVQTWLKEMGINGFESTEVEKKEKPTKSTSAAAAELPAAAALAPQQQQPQTPQQQPPYFYDYQQPSQPPSPS